MKTITPKTKTNEGNGKSPRKNTQHPKITLGAGRYLAEIDYDAVFDNAVRK